jgi:hypothetical protein
MRPWLTLTVALIVAMAMTAAEAATKKRAAGPVARGCTQVIPPYCTGVTTARGTYALFGANPFIPPGIGVDVYGTVTGTSPCGAAIQVTSWKQNRLRCTR